MTNTNQTMESVNDPKSHGHIKNGLTATPSLLEI
jgi:hypothetical protein